VSTRRTFMAGLGAAAAWPLAARAQQGARVRHVGLLMPVANDALGQAWASAFQQELARLGWAAGVAVEVRWAEGRDERYAEIAADFVRLKVDVIVAGATPPTLAAMKATSTIPIVFVGVADPVGTGLVATLARPGGNVTGLSNQTADIAGKRLQLMRELIPALSRVGIMVNPGNAGSMLEKREIEAAARALGLDVVTLEIRRAEDIAPAFEALKGPALALCVLREPLLNANAVRINTLALSARLPTMFGIRETVEIGGLMSYGSDTRELYRRAAADYVDKILRGIKPSDIPVEQPTKFDFVINLTTAKALGITVPPTLLAVADKIIE
jgi:putative tryptophan/tyrosine transport system substrate-binding protein